MELAVNYSYKRKSEEQDLIGKLEMKDAVDEDEGGIDCSLKLGLPYNPPVPPNQPVLNVVQVHDGQQSLPLPPYYNYYSTALHLLPPPPPPQVMMNSYPGVMNHRGNVCYINGGMGPMDPRVSSRVNIPFHLAGRMINLNGMRSNNIANINNIPGIGFGFYGAPMIMSPVGIIRPHNMHSNSVINNNNNIIERSLSSIPTSPLHLLDSREIGNEAAGIDRNSNKCSKCHTTETPMWRKGPDGSKSLCNACGLRFRKELKRKVDTEGNKKGVYKGESST